MDEIRTGRVRPAAIRAETGYEECHLDPDRRHPMPLIVVPIVLATWMLVLVAVVALCRNAARGDRVVTAPRGRAERRFLRFVA
jgi:hypothetical protein